MKKFKQSDVLENLPKQFFAKLVQKVEAAKQVHDDIINLGQGNPDQPTPAHIVEALKKAAGNPNYHKYSPFRGYSFLKEAVCTYYKREYDVELDPTTEVAVLFGAKAGLVEVSQCLLNQGDVALVPDPGYPDYWSGVAIAGGEMALMPLLAENDFLPDFSKLEKETLQRAKLMFLNYPNNPTGAIATKELFEQAIVVGDEHDICVVHDFAYGAIGFEGKRPISFMQIPGAKDVGIEMMTMSKTYNMAGWRIGFAVGNASVIEGLNLIQDHYYCSIFGGIQEAAATALLDSQICVDELVNCYEKRRNTFIKTIQEIGWDVEAPKGSFFAWLPVPKGYTSEEFADLLLEKARVVVAPGNGFGQYGEGYVRVGLLSDEKLLVEAAKRIEELHIF
ncbi:pyridoxal phosphate-dependent aminotransferase [Anaerobacillus isosaccharinicus]|uniref:LL-diaminopimelate aminotransferase n=1 Tax=Anaerobacillus isosaccharinicus TaxID=1532552 RepID=A0A1S2LF75_9BACI|nr:pyridoxal phosphate-dependent aminotransferase [Anaerobacillus isosaccharinicus]MBA5586278.1 pyridoxal phosphate-dependent aminotransferase [Anaerobacillus isosaccharinicus]QOY35470.1 pyridoxal phosphate-dependent aminotransferase [Anaerobacillus isosaccharinicus]